MLGDYLSLAQSYFTDSIKGGVNPVTLSEPEFFALFTILNLNVYISITDINHLP